MARRRLGRADGVVVRFAVRAAAALLVLGAVLHVQLEGMLRERALAETVRSATVVENLGLAPRLLRADLMFGMTPRTVALFDQALSKAAAAGTVERIVIYEPGGRIVYSDEHELIGRQTAHPDSLRRALDGETVVRVADEGVAGEVLEVHAPLRLTGDGAGVSGAFELHLPYGHVAQAVAADTRRLALLLMAGLTGLFAALYGIVARASRRLRDEHDRNRHQALHDALTGLPNRILLFDRISQSVKLAVREHKSTAVLLLDLDHFKEVNDTLGHHNGDALLVEVAKRLQSHVRASDTVARLGGDEFAILLPSCAGAAPAIEVARALRDRLQVPLEVGGLLIGVEASIGIAVAPEDGETPEQLLQRADVAMYQAKSGRTGVSVYDASQDHYTTDRLALLSDLREAIARAQLVLHYQAKADVDSGEVVGVEALARWDHPVHGPIAPEVFIPLAEQTTLIGPLTEQVLEQALADCSTWTHLPRELTVAVNVSVRNLHDPDFPFLVSSLLQRYDVAPQRLILEITETALMHDPAVALQTVGRLRATGVQLSIDDYGTGYSSLSYLQHLAVTELKIDRRFVARLHQSASDRLIVKSTAELGRSLGLRVVAEGVESDESWQALREMGCDALQGYVLTPPVPAGEFPQWLEAYRSRRPETSAR